MYCILIETKATGSMIIYPVIYKSYEEAEDSIGKIPYSSENNIKKIAELVIKPSLNE